MQETYKRNVLRTGGGARSGAGCTEELKVRHIVSAVVKGDVLKSMVVIYRLIACRRFVTATCAVSVVLSNAVQVCYVELLNIWLHSCDDVSS